MPDPRAEQAANRALREAIAVRCPIDIAAATRELVDARRRVRRQQTGK